jgi:hypothetical protein
VRSTRLTSDIVALFFFDCRRDEGENNLLIPLNTMEQVKQISMGIILDACKDATRFAFRPITFWTFNQRASEKAIDICVDFGW